MSRPAPRLAIQSNPNVDDAISSNVRLWHLIPAIVATGYLVYSLLIVAYARDGFPTGKPIKTDELSFPYLADMPLGEDAFYMLTVAWNIGTRGTITYNYDSPTTGIQPLSTFIYGAFAAVVSRLGGDKADFARFVLLYVVLLHLVFSFLIAKLTLELARVTGAARTGWLFSISFTLPLLSFYLFRWITYGLETGLYLCLSTVSILYWMKLKMSESRSMADLAKLGLLLGLTVLARLDFGVVLAVVFVAWLFQRDFSWRRALTAGFPVALLAVPWLIYVFSVSGKWIPSSGSAQARLITLADTARVKAAVVDTLENLTPWFQCDGSSNYLIFVFAFIPLLWILAGPPRAGAVRERIAAAVRILWPWITGMMALSAVYVASFWALHFYKRYFLPISLVGVPLVAICLHQKLFNSRRSNLWFVSIHLVIIVSFGISAGSHLHRSRENSLLPYLTGWIQRTFSQDARIGTFQSGVAGYFNENVMNLDGKIDYHALGFLKQDRLEEYIDSQQVDVLVDWVRLMNNHMKPAYLWDWTKVETGRKNILCYVRNRKARDRSIWRHDPG